MASFEPPPPQTSTTTTTTTTTTINATTSCDVNQFDTSRSCCQPTVQLDSKTTDIMAAETSQDLCGPAATTVAPLIEFAVNVESRDDMSMLERVLERKGVEIVASDLAEKTIQVRHAAGQRHSDDDVSGDQKREQALDVKSLQVYVEQETGFLAVIKGMGQLATVVAELRPTQSASSQMYGVLRLSQMEHGACFVDGLLEGTICSTFRQSHHSSNSSSTTTTTTKRVSLAVHEFGDLSSDSCDSIGRPTIELLPPKSISFAAGANGAESSTARLSIQRVVAQCDVTSLIGKSVALTAFGIESSSGESAILSAGVIARASTIEANKKQVCTCSGKTLWQERVERQKGEDKN